MFFRKIDIINSPKNTLSYIILFVSKYMLQLNILVMSLHNFENYHVYYL